MDERNGRWVSIAMIAVGAILTIIGIVIYLEALDLKFVAGKKDIKLLVGGLFMLVIGLGSFFQPNLADKGHRQQAIPSWVILLAGVVMMVVGGFVYDRWQHGAAADRAEARAQQAASEIASLVEGDAPVPDKVAALVERLATNPKPKQVTTVEDGSGWLVELSYSGSGRPNNNHYKQWSSLHAPFSELGVKEIRITWLESKPVKSGGRTVYEDQEVGVGSIDFLLLAGDASPEALQKNYQKLR